ncbi:MAG: hypothetical protein ACTS73_02705 [Arsenophonus sp. NEOnobi-MAG3]
MAYHEGVLTLAASLAMEDNAISFWNAMAKIFPNNVAATLLVQKTANVLPSLPKGMQLKVKPELELRRNSLIARER